MNGYNVDIILSFYQWVRNASCLTSLYVCSKLPQNMKTLSLYTNQRYIFCMLLRVGTTKSAIFRNVFNFHIYFSSVFFFFTKLCQKPWPQIQYIKRKIIQIKNKQPEKKRNEIILKRNLKKCISTIDSIL